MNTTIIVVLGLLVLAGAAFWLYRSKAVSSAAPKEEPQKKAGNLSPEQSDLFQLGLNPASDGVTTMYALETCRHCRRTREFMEDNKLPFHIIYVDQFSGEQRSALMDKVRDFNPRGSFPTVILPGGKVVVGYREQLLREALIHDTPRAS